MFHRYIDFVLQILHQKIKKNISHDHITLQDTGYFHRGHHPDRKGGHFSVTLVSSDFTDLNAVKRHQKVYAALDMPANTDIHALELQCYTPEEWHTHHQES